MRSHSSCLFSHWSATVGGHWHVRSNSSCLFWHWSATVGGLWLERFHSSCLFDIGQPVLVDFNFCAPTRRVFFHWSVTIGGLWHVRSPSSCLFDIGQSLLVDFDLCAPIRLVFLILVSHCWWTLTCAFPLVLSFLTLITYYWWTLTCALALVLSFWCWSVTVGGLWLVRSLPSCLFWHVLSFWCWSITVGGLWLVRSLSSCLFDFGQSLLVDFDLRASARFVFFSLVSHCWCTLTCALPLILYFWHWSATVGGLWLVRSHSSCLFDIGQSLMVDFNFCVHTRLVFLTLVSHGKL